MADIGSPILGILLGLGERAREENKRRELEQKERRERDAKSEYLEKSAGLLTDRAVAVQRARNERAPAPINDIPLQVERMRGVNAAAHDKSDISKLMLEYRLKQALNSQLLGGRQGVANTVATSRREADIVSQINQTIKSITEGGKAHLRAKTEADKEAGRNARWSLPSGNVSQSNATRKQISDDQIAQDIDEMNQSLQRTPGSEARIIDTTIRYLKDNYSISEERRAQLIELLEKAMQRRLGDVGSAAPGSSVGQSAAMSEDEELNALLSGK